VPILDEVKIMNQELKFLLNELKCMSRPDFKDVELPKEEVIDRITEIADNEAIPFLEKALQDACKYEKIWEHINQNTDPSKPGSAGITILIQATRQVIEKLEKAIDVCRKNSDIKNVKNNESEDLSQPSNKKSIGSSLTPSEDANSFSSDEIKQFSKFLTIKEFIQGSWGIAPITFAVVFIASITAIINYFTGMDSGGINQIAIIVPLGLAFISFIIGIWLYIKISILPLHIAQILYGFVGSLSILWLIIGISGGYYVGAIIIVPLGSTLACIILYFQSRKACKLLKELGNKQFDKTKFSQFSDLIWKLKRGSKLLPDILTINFESTKMNGIIFGEYAVFVELEFGEVMIIHHDEIKLIPSTTSQGQVIAEIHRDGGSLQKIVMTSETAKRFEDWKGVTKNNDGDTLLLVASQKDNSKQFLSIPLNSPAAMLYNALGILFDVNKIKSGGYGIESWKIFWRLIQGKELYAKLLLYEGDLMNNDTIFCIGVLAFDQKVLDQIKQLFQDCDEFQRVAANPYFIAGSSVKKEPLPQAGVIDELGNFTPEGYNSKAAYDEILK
jgi:hypothetical protein